jgi:hypothetical protein
MFKNF